MANTTGTKAKDVERILSALDGPSVLSLDVFDTALVRKTLRPRDTFRVLEEGAVHRHGEALRGLANARNEAERRVDATWRGRPSPDHLSRIWECVGEIHPACALHVEELREQELEIEAELLVTSGWCQDLFERSLAAGKKVLFLSDMYLPSERISAWLRREGYDGFEALYVSAETGASKHDGTLFRHVMAERGLHPSDIVHVGDQREADRDVPAGLGIRAFWCPPAREIVRKNAAFVHLNEFHFDARSVTAADRVTLGLGVRRWLAADGKQEDRESVGDLIGYQVLGPLQLSFVAWVLERARRYDLADLYFVARDAYITKLVFDEVAKHGFTNIRGHYLRASRVSLFVSHMAEVGPEAAVEDVFRELDYFGMKLTVGRHLVRLGLPAREFEDLVRSSELGSLDRVVDTEALRQAYMLLIREMGSRIREICESHQVAYERYSKELGVDEAERVGLVDNTSSGRTFLRLRELFERRNPGIQVVRGLYTYVPNEIIRLVRPGDSIEGWLYDFTDEGISSDDLSFRSIYEDSLLGAPEDSFVRAEDRGGRSEFVFHPGSGGESYDPYTRAIHDGALRFVRDHLETAGRLGVGAPSRSLAYAGFKRFCYSPTPAEGKYFRGRKIGDWTLGDQGSLYLVAPEPAWNTHSPVSLRADLRRSRWRSGFVATLPAALRRSLEVYEASKEPLQATLRWMERWRGGGS
jgi:FMN phosphatase YigB (HAD superfamily)